MHLSNWILCWKDVASLQLEHNFEQQMIWDSLRQGSSGPSSLALAPLAENAYLLQLHVLTDECKFGRKCSYVAGNNFMRVWTNLCNRKCSDIAGNNFMWVWTNLCERKCSYVAGNDFMRVWTNLCYRESLSVTNGWQELHFEFSRQN